MEQEERPSLASVLTAQFDEGGIRQEVRYKHWQGLTGSRRLNRPAKKKRGAQPSLLGQVPGLYLYSVIAGGPLQQVDAASGRGQTQIGIKVAGCFPRIQKDPAESSFYPHPPSE